MPETNPRDVVVAALVTRLPHSEDRPHVEERADLIVAALIEHGHLPGPEHVTTVEEIEEIAQWLAEHSQFARYTQSDEGWRKIIASEMDVNVAATYAARNAITETERENVQIAKATLLRWHGRKVATA